MLIQAIAKIGERTLHFFDEFGQISILFLKIHRSMYRIIRDRRLIIAQMEHIGVNSLPLVLIIAVFTGAVAAWQAAYQLKGLAPLSFIG
ncbi:MAG: ABC transporter permease, partial [Ignavibacteria bacterium]|nr:ABC transporter permease [Ignavibacteria bacterium]